MDVQNAAPTLVRLGPFFDCAFGGYGGMSAFMYVCACNGDCVIFLADDFCGFCTLGRGCGCDCCHSDSDSEVNDEY